MATKDIIPACYAPLAPLTKYHGGPVDPIVERLAKKYGKTPAQILLRWNEQLGSIVITTSGNEQRMKEQLNYGGYTLSDSEMDEILQAGLKYERRSYWGHIASEFDPQI